MTSTTNQQTPDSSASVTPSKARQVQIASTSFLALFSIVGLALYGLPLFYPDMVTEFGWTRSQVTSGNALSKLLVGPLFGFIAGWIVDRFGPRRLMMVGIMMAATALVGLSFISTLGFFYFFYLFNALGYVCGGPLPNQVLLSRWFDKSRGKAMGFAYLGIGIGGVVVPQLVRLLKSSYDWHTALLIIGILVAVIALPMAFFVKDSPSGRVFAKAQQPTPVSIAPILRSPYFYLLAVGSMCSIAAVGGIYQNLRLYLSLDRGLDDPSAYNLASIVLGASLFGRILMGWLADRFPKKYVMILIYMLVASGIPMLFLIKSTWALYTFAIVFGIGLGGDYMIIPLMAAEIFGVRVLGRVMGIILTADGVAEAVAPWTVSKLYDINETYSTGFTILIVLALLGAVAVSFLPKKRAGEV